MLCITLAAIFLFSCNAPHEKSNAGVSTSPQQALGNDQMTQEAPADSIIIPADSLFKKPELVLKEITAAEFEGYSKASNPDFTVGPNGYISGYGFSVSTNCRDICETYLGEQKSKKKMLLPSGFDTGVRGVVFSPSGSRFMIYSSYDLPDYDAYYSYRAEIRGFKTGNRTLEAIKPAFYWQTKDWSIAGIAWTGNNGIALKVYNGESPETNVKSHYRYFKAAPEL